MRHSHALLSACLVLTALAHTARGADQDQDSSGVSLDLDVISRRLDVARQQIQPSLGASVYNFSPQALENVPQGENAPLDQVLLQAPGVAQDSFGQIHLRGEHANVQYRLNGVRTSRGVIGIRSGDRVALCQQHVAHHRCTARAIRFPDCGRGRHPDQDRRHGSRPRGHDVRRKLELGAAELRIRRAQRAGRLVCYRRLSAQRSRDRGSHRQFQRDPRHYQPVPRHGLCVRRH